MILDSVSGSSTVTGQQATSDRNQLQDDLNKFLTLLVSQLQHQDPLEPLDAHEFTSQLVQFASVEQQIYSNSHLEDLLAAQKGADAAGAVNYLGKTVQVESDTLKLENGSASAGYALTEPAAKTTVTVTDSQGRAVFSTAGETGQGSHDFVWTGSDGNGTELADGLYTVSVDARREDGTQIPVTTTLTGTVHAAGFNQGAVTLDLGGFEVPLESVLAVTAPPAAAEDESASSVLAALADLL
ncbi:MAG TPA: flagellar hook assembly protein FlgD [Candidatus Defluviicoccus seviourii]|nr:flagellar hook assembly protein FlgD [Candidatus Defluviicoccus seviourii]